MSLILFAAALAASAPTEAGAAPPPADYAQQQRAYQEAVAKHDAEMARWRADVASRGTPPAPTSTAATTVASADPNQTVCRRETAVGSNIPTRRCQTRGQWAAEDAARRTASGDYARAQSSSSH